MYFTKQELQQISEIYKALNENNITYTIAETLLGENATPELILEISEEMKAIPLNEYEYKYFDFNKADTTYTTDEDGPSIIGALFGFSKHTAKKFVKDPKTAGMCLRALRDKYEEVSFKEARAKAEHRGFFATVLYTIKKAMYWIVKKFADLKDDFLDLIKGRPENASRTKRDYNWLRNAEDHYLANNTDWFINSEH